MADEFCLKCPTST